jgi:hypothetical protein
MSSDPSTVGRKAALSFVARQSGRGIKGRRSHQFAPNRWNLSR